MTISSLSRLVDILPDAGAHGVVDRHTLAQCRAWDVLRQHDVNAAAGGENRFKGAVEPLDRSETPRGASFPTRGSIRPVFDGDRRRPPNNPREQPPCRDAAEEKSDG